MESSMQKLSGKVCHSRPNCIEVGKMKIGSIVIRCYEFDKMMAFWRETLHYAPRRPVKGGWVVLWAPEGEGPDISLDQVAEKRSGKRGRWHLHLGTNNKEGELGRRGPIV